MGNTVVIKLGGSLLSKDEKNIFDFSYLAELKKIIELQEFLDKKFFIAVGGGYTMRKYRDLAKDAGADNDLDLHWIGTTVNVLHAYILKAFFGQIADDDVVKYEDYYREENTHSINSKLKLGGGSSVINYDIANQFEIANKIKVGGGGRPGHSGDVDAILAAKKLGSKIVISLKNVDGVYTADPKNNPEATMLETLNWQQYLDIIGNKDTHEPGGNYPIDPIASKMAIEAGITFVIIGGDNLENFKKYMLGKEFKGSVVS